MGMEKRKAFLGIDIGTSTVQMVVLEEGEIIYQWGRPHYGKLLPVVEEGFRMLENSGISPEPISIYVTGANAAAFMEVFRDKEQKPILLDEIPAIVAGVRRISMKEKPEAWSAAGHYRQAGAAQSKEKERDEKEAVGRKHRIGSIIEIGSQSARFITALDQAAPLFAVNEHCAGGTGSFFEDQMSRLGLQIEDYSDLVAKAKSVPRLSGRCAVFAKTDIIHRQQEGLPTADILLGLCYAMICNYKATIVRSMPVEKPVYFVGGVTKNAGTIRAIRQVFELGEDELIVPAEAEYAAAIGAAWQAASASGQAGENVRTEMQEPAGKHGRAEMQESAGKHGRTEMQEPAGKYTRGEHQRAGYKLTELRGLLIAHQARKKRIALPRLTLKEGTPLNILPVNGICQGKLSLGIDIGSTSTDLVIIDEQKKLLDAQYLRTAGDPEKAVRQGLASIRERFGEIEFYAVGVTGSGRERIGRMIGADAIRDEITAQARGAVHCDPAVDTVFEIGGQDSKYISIRDGNVVDFQMNKICAAGTGSFVEEQAARMNIPLSDFGSMALRAEAPAELGERCTVFIETAIASAIADGLSAENIAAGLCYSIVRNYLTKVVGSKPVGQHIVLQGGVNYNAGIVAAFQQAYGDKVHVSPYFSISGAFGAALLAAEAIGAEGHSRFHGFDEEKQKKKASLSAAEEARQAEIRRNIAFYQRANKLLLDGYDGKIDPKKKTVGVPYVLMIHKFFPMANAYFRSLGYNVLLTQPTNEDTIALSQQLAQGETCYPVKLIYGHMQQLIDQKVDYIFLPSIHTMKHETSKVAHNYGCVYMQTAPRSIAKVLQLEEKGITLLNPVFDLDFGSKAMAGAMVGLGKILGKPKAFCVKALMSGAAAVRKHGAAVEKMGSELMASLQQDDKVLVLITRNYGLGDPVLNMQIPRILLERGHKVITLGHLPAHDLDISADHPNLYWPFGQHILSGAKIVAHHPNLYAVYLTNHGCGPDGMISHLFRGEMGDKPYLQIEVDEHFSPVGVVTRIEAFLNSLSHRESLTVPRNFDLKAVSVRSANIKEKAAKDRSVVLPDFGWYSETIAMYMRECGYQDVQIMKMASGNEGLAEIVAADAGAEQKSCASVHEVLKLGKSFTNTKEYVTFTALMGSLVKDLQKRKIFPQYILPQTRGAEADGQYARVIRAEIDRLGYQDVDMLAAPLETLPATLENMDLFCRAIALADLIYAVPDLQIAGDMAISANGEEEKAGIRMLSHRQMFAEEILQLKKNAEGVIERSVPDWADLGEIAAGIQMAGKSALRSHSVIRQGSRTMTKVSSENAFAGMADSLGNMHRQGGVEKRIMAVGTPMLLTSLEEGVLSRLEADGSKQILRTPMLEYLWMMWMDQKEAEQDGKEDFMLLKLEREMKKLGEKLGDYSAFAKNPRELLSVADEELPGFAGANGRYRYAKILQPAEKCNAVLHLVPRYENTEMVLEMRGTAKACPLPYYNLALDGDWDGAAESRLRSFLYYIKD